MFTKNRDRLRTTEMSGEQSPGCLLTLLIPGASQGGAAAFRRLLLGRWRSVKGFGVDQDPPAGEKARSGGDDDPRDPPDTSVPPASSHGQATAEPDQLPRPTRRHRNAEVDL